MDPILIFLTKPENKHYKRAWLMYVFSTLQDKYFIRLAMFGKSIGLFRQNINAYLNGTSVPTEDYFTKIYNGLMERYECIMMYEIPQNFDELIQLLDFLIEQERLNKQNG